MRIVSLSIGLVLALWLARAGAPNPTYARGALALELDGVGPHPAGVARTFSKIVRNGR